MRFPRKIHKEGDTRVRMGFLLLPKTLPVAGYPHDYRETRRLEAANVVQEYRISMTGTAFWADLYFNNEG